MKFHQAESHATAMTF